MPAFTVPIFTRFSYSQLVLEREKCAAELVFFWGGGLTNHQLKLITVDVEIGASDKKNEKKRR